LNNRYHSIRAVKRSALALFAGALFAGSGATASAAEQVSAPSHVEAEMLDGGGSYSLAARDAGITLISVWSPESLSSRKCIGELERFAAAYASRGVYTLAASTLDDKDALRAFVAKRKLTVPVAVLGKHDLGKQDDVRLPLVYVFDAKGQLRAAHAGLFSLSVLERMVVPLLSP
jgi:hypothetical protein